jgi:type I pantothenate kinase
MKAKESLSPYLSFDRAEWSQLRASIRMPLHEAELPPLLGLNESLSLDEVFNIYLPLSRLLHLIVTQQVERAKTIQLFLDNTTVRIPFVIGIAGSVAVGKSTTARILQALLKRWPHHPQVELVTTDGFLFPNAILEERDLMSRKGFPESYDIRRLMQFLIDLKSGKPERKVPIYSHLTYDILADQFQVIDQPPILILEGLNILQNPNSSSGLIVSDFIDFSIYVDAKIEDIAHWYVERFHLLCQTAFRHSDSYFRRYATLNPAEATQTAQKIWQEINQVNLLKNILPTRPRADLILQKGPGHTVQKIQLRKF